MYAALVYLTVFAVAACGLVYQLLAGAVSSYLLGESVVQFSLAIGVFLSALGLGAHLSRKIEGAPGRVFVEVSYAAAVVGGIASELLFLAFARTGFFRPTLYTVLIAEGTLTGLQLPLLLRVLRRHVNVRELASRALTVDYAGAVVGSLLFSLWFAPRVGLVRTGLFFGTVHALCALAATWVLGPAVGPPNDLRLRGVLTAGGLAFLTMFAPKLSAHAEDAMYPDPIVFARQTAYQRLVVTSGRGSFQLFLDGNLQFASVDEHRYHEALVHPAFAVSHARAREGRGPGARDVLVLGGGDGLAVREILKHPTVRSVTLVDLDPAMTALGRDFTRLVELNRRSLHDPRVRVVNADAMLWLAERAPGAPGFDVAVVDFPDPNNFSLGKLYTTRFYALLQRALAPEGVAVVQSTSPLMARQSFWCVATTMEAAGFFVRAYHAPVPSFGEWGYMLASRTRFEVPTQTLAGLRYIDDAVLPTLFVFPPDMQRVAAEVNRLNTQSLVQYYEREWRRYNQ